MVSQSKDETIVFRFEKLYRCRFAGNGEQVCFFLGYQRRGEMLAVRKWLSKSRRWTKKVFIERSDVLGVASKAFCEQRGVDFSALKP
jgi:hypothetical protein